MHSLGKVWFEELDPNIEVKVKRCIKCGIERKLEEFRRDRSKSDGLNNQCRSCLKAYHAEYKIKKNRVFDISVDTKLCKKCGEFKSSTEFHPHKRMLDGLSTSCRQCHNKQCSDNQKKHREKLLAYCKVKYEKCKSNGLEPRDRSPEWQNLKNSQLRRIFGIGVDEFVSMWESQGGRCATCGKHWSEQGKDLFVDHNHKTGKVRQLLCHHCNAGIGHAKEDKLILQSWISYLDKHEITVGT